MATDGFVRLPNWLIDDSDLTLQELAVYIVLLRFRDHRTGKCYPGMATIADSARVSRETVKRVIPKLEARGMVKVTKRKQGTKNLPNLYEIALASETPEFIWEISQRGRRIPKRAPRHSETPPKRETGRGRHSETLPRHSETPGVGTRSASNKTYKNKIHEQALRRTQESAPANLFTFDEAAKITASQLDYLNDLHLFLTEHPVPAQTRENWEALDTSEASNLIRTYWKQMDRGRGGMWESAIDEYHPLYRHLTARGKEWINKGCVPDTLEDAA